MDTTKQGKHEENESCRFRLFKHLKSEPASTCFLLSVILIATTMASLGLYVKTIGKLPDLDIMKNWNAYLGKMESKNYCFLEKTTSKQSFNNIFKGINYNGSVYNRNRTQYGTVNVKINFSVSRNFVEESNATVIYSNFTGWDVGTQIHAYPSGKRIDSEINLYLWINLSLNNTEDCTRTSCPVDGCLIVSAPLSAVPAKMPHLHQNFTFASKLYEIKTKPQPCSIINADEYVAISEICIRRKDQCNNTFPSVIALSKLRNFKSNSIISIYLSEEDKIKASKHMFIASLSLIFLEVSFVAIITLRHRIRIKFSRE